MLKYLFIILIIVPGKFFARNARVFDPCVPVVTIAENQNNICLNTSVTIHATVTNNGTGGLYNWKLNNLYVGVANYPDYTSAGFRNGDVVICEYTCKTPCGVDTTVVSNPITINVANDVTPLTTISNDDPLICEGEVTTFVATSFYGNEIPFYQWTVNNLPVGTNSSVYTTNSITNGSKVECTMTISSSSCPGTSQSVNSQLTIYVYPLVHPVIDILPSKTDICKGETVSFTAIANGGPSADLSWEVNGIPNGVIASSFSTSTLQDGDVVSCTVTVAQDSRCQTSLSAASNKITIHVRDFLQPSVTIAAPVLEVCIGKPITFTATPQNAGFSRYYQWRVNGHNVNSGNATFIFDKFADGDSVSCNLSTDIPGCPLSASAASNVKMVTIRDTPVITFSPPEITILAGEQAQLNASVTAGLSSYLWKPAGGIVTPLSLTPVTIPLLQDTGFNLSVVDVNGCKAAKDLQVKVLHKLYMPTGFTPNNDGTNDVFRIPPGTSLLLREFSIFSRWGNAVFITNDISKGWDGKYLGEEASNGIYVYIIKGIFNDDMVTIKGTVSLLR